MFDKRNKLCSQVEDEARKFFSEQVYQTMIPRNIRISEAPSHGLPVLSTINIAQVLSLMKS